ncbi:MAG: isochorismatase family protein [Deltaproteobacteria bacterium]|nr:isochorismatase family protein [Deltaproteobacteria bacterium]
MFDGPNRLLLQREGTVLVLVDVQERIVLATPPPIWREVRKNIRILLEASQIMKIPIIVTEQYPEGLGHLVQDLQGPWCDNTIAKTSFNCCREEAFLDRLKEKNARQVLMVGMESHVCIYQTTLALLHRGYPVHLATDAIGARYKKDHQIAVANANQAGATLTTVEMALFQMLKDSKAPEFRAVSALVKER